MSARRGKWPAPAPSPRILHLPRRSRLSSRPAKPSSPPLSRRNLRQLLNQERPLAVDPPRRTVRSPEHVPESGRKSVSERIEERRRMECEILGSECKLVPTEGEIEVRELMDAASRSVRKKIDLRDEAKLEDLQMSLRGCVIEDRRRSVLRQWPEKLPSLPVVVEEEAHVREIREIAANDVEMLKRKMEGLSRGLSEKMEEYGFFLSAPSTTAAGMTGGTIAGVRRRRRPHRQNRQAKEEEEPREQEATCTGRSCHCCCHCKVLVGRIVEQVRVESEQWSEMQLMLDRVRSEITDLQSSRDLWQRRAINTGLNLRSLHSQMMEWRQRALDSEHEAGELKIKVSRLDAELDALRIRRLSPSASCSRNPENPRIKSQLQCSLVSQKEKEKHVLVCRLKQQQRGSALKRSPLKEISNSNSVFVEP